LTLWWKFKSAGRILATPAGRIYGAWCAADVKSIVGALMVMTNKWIDEIEAAKKNAVDIL
jgi:hypothetical protein